MNYDKIIIGSSPICLLEAIFHDSQGMKTCIIDNAGELGGAWKKLNMGNDVIKNVEVGCHIIEKDREVFDFFKKKLHSEMHAMNPQPKVIIKNRPIPYNFKNFIFLARNFKKYFSYKSGLRQFIYDINVLGKELQQFNLNYYNFSKESITFIENLTSEISKRNIVVLLSTKINSVRVNTADNVIELNNEKNEIIRTNKLIITHNSNFNEMYINEKDKTDILQSNEYEYVHLHIFIKDKQLKKISYWRVFGNEMIHRISNMSNQVSIGEHEHLICVGIFSSFLQNKTESVVTNNVIAELKKMELISNSCVILKTQLNSYKGRYTNHYDLKKIEAETNNLVEVINTMDISKGIKENLFKYNTVVYSTY